MKPKQLPMYLKKQSDFIKYLTQSIELLKNVGIYLIS